MPPSNTRSSHVFIDALKTSPAGVAFVVLIFGALIAFEVFNYSTTDHALGDLLGNLDFAGMQWSTILALAFCGIDFAGIARLFTPERGMDEPKEVWYLFGAWLLAATMNAILTWWGVSMAVTNHSIQSSSVIDPQTITGVVPIFVAIMVWVIRILIIGTLSLSIDRLLHPGVEQRTAIQGAVAAVRASRTSVPVYPSQPMNVPAALGSSAMPQRPAVAARHAAPATPRGRSLPVVDDTDFVPEPPARSARPEPTYHSLSMNNNAARPQHPNTNNGNTGANRFRQS